MGRYVDEDDEVVGRNRSMGVGTFLAGLALGAGLALLLAPESGEDLRRRLKRNAKRAQHAAEDLAVDAKKRVRRVAEDVKGRAEEMMDDARHEFESRMDDARHAVSRRRRDLTRAVDAGKATAREAKESFERRLEEARNDEPSTD